MIAKLFWKEKFYTARKKNFYYLKFQNIAAFFRELIVKVIVA